MPRTTPFRGRPRPGARAYVKQSGHRFRAGSVRRAGWSLRSLTRNRWSDFAIPRSSPRRRYSRSSSRSSSPRISARNASRNSRSLSSSTSPARSDAPSADSFEPRCKLRSRVALSSSPTRRSATYPSPPIRRAMSPPATCEEPASSSLVALRLPMNWRRPRGTAPWAKATPSSWRGWAMWR